jgi:hypothetical protein
MIDTIRLIFDEGNFAILEPERFQPHAKTILELGERLQSGGIKKCVLNPKKGEALKGNYLPRLTLRRRPLRITELVIEFSAPKLLYGNNFDELTEQDFDAVVKALTAKLATLGIYIFAELLRMAPVGAIHYGKNIILPRHTLCSSVIRLLSKAPVSRLFDTNQVEFRNDGHLYKIHTNSFELAFYDKVKDLQKANKTERRSYEVDNDIQIDLFKQAEIALDTQVLRMEARLNNRSQIQRMLKAINLPDDDLRFFALFRKEIAQKALLHYWEPYRSSLSLIAMAKREDPHRIMSFLINNDPDATMGTQLQRLGAMVMIGDIGWNGLRSYWQGYEQSFRRLKTDIANLPTRDENPLAEIKEIDATLRAFEPVKMGRDLKAAILSESCSS